MRISVIGMGKIGLPLAAHFAHQGHHVTGVDIDAERVAAINRGEEPFPGETDLAEYMERLVPSRHLRATSDYGDAVPEADVIVVVVPLFVGEDDKPDFRHMDAATRDIAANLTRDTLVVYETTLPVGTTRNRWAPLLEEGSGLTEGTDFHVAFSPERVLTGRVFEDLRKYPKLVGGLSAAGAARATEFYDNVLEFDPRVDLHRDNGVWDLGSAEAAEMVKLAETTYRDVNIGLANQFAVFAERSGIDIYQVIDAANSQPFSHIHRPGISVGGHCIPVYPRLYLSGDPDATVVSAAREANAGMPRHAVEVLHAAVGDLSDLTVAILGCTYRPGVKETAFSGVFPLVTELEKLGARPVVHDPFLDDEEITELGLTPYHVGDEASAALVHTAHPEYGQLGTADLPGLQFLIDGRNTVDPEKWPGVRVITLGQNSQRPSTSNPEGN